MRRQLSLLSRAISGPKRPPHRNPRFRLTLVLSISSTACWPCQNPHHCIGLIDPTVNDGDVGRLEVDLCPCHIWGMTHWRLSRFLGSVTSAERLMQKKRAFTMPSRVV